MVWSHCYFKSTIRLTHLPHIYLVRTLSPSRPHPYYFCLCSSPFNYQLPNGLIKVRRRWGQRHPQGANSGSISYNHQPSSCRQRERASTHIHTLKPLPIFDKPTSRVRCDARKQDSKWKKTTYTIHPKWHHTRTCVPTTPMVAPHTGNPIRLISIFSSTSQFIHSYPHDQVLSMIC
jgi:hypothetical protein